MRKLIATLLMALAYSPQLSWGESYVCQTLTTEVPTASIINAVGTSTTGSINYETGANSGIGSAFELKTNVADGYKYMIRSEIELDDGSLVSGYTWVNSTDAGVILANTESGKRPTKEAIDDIKNGIRESSPNAIEYAVTTTSDGNITFDVKERNKYGGVYIRGKNYQTGTTTISQNLSTLPNSNTYEKTLDEAGTYEATIYFSTYP